MIEGTPQRTQYPNQVPTRGPTTSSATTIEGVVSTQAVPVLSSGKPSQVTLSVATGLVGLLQSQRAQRKLKRLEQQVQPAIDAVFEALEPYKSREPTGKENTEFFYFLRQGGAGNPAAIYDYLSQQPYYQPLPTPPPLGPAEQLTRTPLSTRPTPAVVFLQSRSAPLGVFAAYVPDERGLLERLEP